MPEAPGPAPAEIAVRVDGWNSGPQTGVGRTGPGASLLQPSKLNTLVEYDAHLGNARYTLAEYLTDMRAGVWNELDNRTVTVSVYRRNLQRAFLDRVNAELNPPMSAAPATR